jgi:hypothetical protein
MVTSGLKPVATGLSIVPASSLTTSADGETQEYAFRAEIGECWEDGHDQFGDWPRMTESTAYFVVFAVASSTGSVNPAVEGTVANTG